MIGETAPAKLNLALHVTGQRADGYHLLDSLVVFAGIADHLTIAEAPKRALSVTGPFAPGVPVGPDNLVWRAIDLLDADRPLAITLEKNLPHGAGLGGGTSDAAAALRGLCAAWRAPLPTNEQLLAIGADLPVCLNGRPVRMSGIGGRLDPVPPLPDFWVVLVNPGVTVPTSACFSALTQKCNPPLEEPVWDSATSFYSWLRGQRNDLEEPARMLAPVIAGCLADLAAAPGCQLARMSGSGATCFGLFDTSQAAAAAVDRLTQPDRWVMAAPILN